MKANDNETRSTQLISNVEPLKRSVLHLKIYTEQQIILNALCITDSLLHNTIMIVVGLIVMHIVSVLHCLLVYVFVCVCLCAQNFCVLQLVRGKHIH